MILDNPFEYESVKVLKLVEKRKTRDKGRYLIIVPCCNKEVIMTLNHIRRWEKGERTKCKRCARMGNLDGTYDALDSRHLDADRIGKELHSFNVLMAHLNHG